MAVNDGYVSALDQCMGKVPLLVRNVIAPIGSPVDRDNNHVMGLPLTRDLVGDAGNSCFRQVRAEGLRPVRRALRPSFVACRSSPPQMKRPARGPCRRRRKAAGALASARLRPAPAVLICRRSSVVKVSSNPVRPQSSTWLLASTQQSMAGGG